jgi:hypothetical protein
LDRERRTNPGFLTNNETERDRKRTEDFVRSITKHTYHLCDACGVRGGTGHWHCKRCNAYFCYKCGKDFAAYQNKVAPDCPACEIELHSERDYQPFSDEQKILRYVTSTQVTEIRNRGDLFDRLSRLFNRDLLYIESIWSNLAQQNPSLIKQITAKFKDEVLKQHYERAQFEALHPEHKSENLIVPEPIKLKDDGKLDIKDAKPIDGLEFEWKQGKMSPVDQKTYRSKLDEQ